jgi:hypothetical protein
VIILKLEKAKTRYLGEWIAFCAIEMEDNPEGKVILAKEFLGHLTRKSWNRR